MSLDQEEIKKIKWEVLKDGNKIQCFYDFFIKTLNFIDVEKERTYDIQFIFDLIQPKKDDNVFLIWSESEIDKFALIDVVDYWDYFWCS